MTMGQCAGVGKERNQGSRWFRRRASHASPPEHEGRASSEASRLREKTKRFVEEGRFAFVLLHEAADRVPDAECVAAWRALDEAMAMVPAGPAPVVRPDGQIEMVDVEGFYLDRDAVTNRRFHQFVDA